MIAFANELATSRYSLNSSRPAGRLRGDLVSVGAEADPRLLQVGQTILTVDIPTQLLAEHRRSCLDDVILLVPQAEPRRVRARPLPSAAQQRAANRWMAEMQDFDRF